ncbi:MAG: Na/Pi cotransporter family protein [Lachnospiraceae bacterium]|jgi:phosphate:Na+ symporter|nr:Na/Pi cotransporter family protein [Lachnospiraceae bacterium]MCI8871892.1 Na/Pi cotransporter family protein [Lachnospiraceae bacterium]GFI31036.1 phosphate-specific transport system accessory protein PhoU [Lachnospiraceae bacterium]
MELILTLLGGLGLFLFGMSFMSQGLQKAAGAKLRTILEAMTKNKIIAVLFGALFTAIIQSSGATTVMVVSFVNTGIMTLAQSVGIIFGANIGTTITSQLVAFNLTGIAPLILFVGAVFMMFGKRPMVKKVGEVILGFGALFMGISMMKDAMSGLREYQNVLNILGSLDNPFLGILLGTAITVVVQSSSVTVSILLLMASQGLVDLSVCFYVVLGCNIGSCTPAVLASLDAKKDAKRAALIHVMFNVFGMVIIGILLAFGMEYFENFILRISGSDVGRCVANADSLFKIFQTLMFLPLSAQFVALTRKLIPGEDAQSEGYQLLYIGKQNIFSPSTAVVETTQEIERMATLASENLKLSMEAFFEGDKEKISRVYETEKQIDFLSHKLTDYLVKINQLQLPVVDANRIGGLFHVVSDIERIGDHAENFADFAVKCQEENLDFTKKGTKEIQEMHHKTMIILEKAMEMFVTLDEKNLPDILALEDDIDHMERELHQNHVKRMSKGKCSPMSGIVFTDMVTGLERVADHATNIAFSILDNDPEERSAVL